MAQIEGDDKSLWTRKEAELLSGFSLQQLLYLEKQGLVIPIRPEEVKGKNQIFYTWKQLVDLRAIKRLRNECRPKQLKEALEYLESINITPDFSDKRLIAYGNVVYWVDNRPEDYGVKIVEASGKAPGQILLTFSYQELVNELWENSSQIIDFEERASLPKSEEVA